MKEYIERAEALDICQKEYEERLRMADYCGDTVAWDIGGAIKGIPSSDVAEGRHGKWVEYPRAHYFKCSECKYTVPYRKAIFVNGNREYDYCPSCGARMDKEDEHEVSE